MDSKGYPELEKVVSSMFVTAGIEYMEHKYWYLSSEIGFIKKGGATTIRYMPTIDQMYEIDVKERWPILQLNTTIRLKIPVVKNHRFIVGAGPAFDLILGSTAPKLGLYSNRASLGIKLDAGYETIIKDRIKVGLIYSYNRSLTPFGEYIQKNVYNQTSLFSLTLGYQL